MPGIKNNSIEEFQTRVERFQKSYVDDWNQWVNTASAQRPHKLGIVLRRWQACRPNKMRRTQAEGEHAPPHLEDLVKRAVPHIQELQRFDIRLADSFTPQAYKALSSLWDIFEQLSYDGQARGGLTGVVGISKAVLLLSDGRVGPAFDSQVRQQLHIRSIETPYEWVESLQAANQDIHKFEIANATTLQRAVPNYSYLHSGRVYDMALGPGG